MISKYIYKKLTWIDVESPTREEITHLSEEYGISPLVGEELLNKSVRSKVDLYDNFIYLILHFPKIGHSHSKNVEQEIDFIIGKDFIITVHYELVDPLHEFSKFFEVQSTLEKGIQVEHAGFLFFLIAKELYKNLMSELDDINRSLKEIEGKIFEGQESNMVEYISATNRKLLDFKQAIRFHGEILRSFENAGKKFFGEEFSYYLSVISGEYNKVHNILESHKEILNDLRETNDSLLTSKTNEIMRRFTAITAIIFFLSLVAGILSMNSHVVFIHDQRDFMITLGIMGFAGLVIFMYFKKKKWL